MTNERLLPPESLGPRKVGSDRGSGLTVASNSSNKKHLTNCVSCEPNIYFVKINSSYFLDFILLIAIKRQNDDA